jgi:hypothetical protein
MITKLLRFAVLALLLPTILFLSLFSGAHTSHAQRSGQRLRGAADAYMQTNTPVGGCGSSKFTVRWNPFERPPITGNEFDASNTVSNLMSREQVLELMRSGGSNTLSNQLAGVAQQGIASLSAGFGATFESLRAGLRGAPSLPGVDTLGGMLAQNNDGMLITVNPENGIIMIVDADGNVIVAEPDGTIVHSFRVFQNYYDEPVTHFEDEDGDVTRFSADAYVMESPEDGETCTCSDGEDTYDFALDEDGFLVYTDEDGYELFLLQDEDGALVLEDSDGLLGEFLPNGEYTIYDENDEPIETGILDNLTLEERAEELGLDPDDPFALFDFVAEEAGLSDGESGDDSADSSTDGSSTDDSGGDSSGESGDGTSGDDSSSDSSSDDGTGDGSSGDDSSGGESGDDSDGN